MREVHTAGRAKSHITTLRYHSTPRDARNAPPLRHCREAGARARAPFLVRNVARGGGRGAGPILSSTEAGGPTVAMVGYSASGGQVGAPTMPRGNFTGSVAAVISESGALEYRGDGRGEAFVRK